MNTTRMSDIEYLVALRINFKHIQHLLSNMYLSNEKDKMSFDAKEEEVFIRQYDIQTFGMSQSKEIREMWRSKELEHNPAVYIISRATQSYALQRIQNKYDDEQ